MVGRLNRQSTKNENLWQADITGSASIYSLGMIGLHGGSNKYLTEMDKESIGSSQLLTQPHILL